MASWTLPALLISSAIALLSLHLHFITQLSRSSVIRGALWRMCIQLASDQVVPCPDDERFANVKHVLREESSAVTAILFLDDPETEKSFVGRLEELSSSLFTSSMKTILALAFGVSVISALVFAYIIGYITLSASEPHRDDIQYLLLLMVGAAGLGVVLSFVWTLVIWRSFIIKSFNGVARILEGQALWTKGDKRRPHVRKVVLFKDDDSYSTLRL